MTSLSIDFEQLARTLCRTAHCAPTGICCFASATDRTPADLEHALRLALVERQWDWTLKYRPNEGYYACVWTPEQGPFATAHEQTDPQAVIALLKAYCQALTHLWALEAA